MGPGTDFKHWPRIQRLISCIGLGSRDRCQTLTQDLETNVVPTQTLYFPVAALPQLGHSSFFSILVLQSNHLSYMWPYFNVPMKGHIRQVWLVTLDRFDCIYFWAIPPSFLSGFYILLKLFSSWVKLKYCSQDVKQ